MGLLPARPVLSTCNSLYPRAFGCSTGRRVKQPVARSCSVDPSHWHSSRVSDDPPYTGTHVLRRDALQAAGLAVPHTWHELRDTAAALAAHLQRYCTANSGVAASPSASSINSSTGSGPAPSEADTRGGCYRHAFCLVLPPGCAHDGAVLAAVWAAMAAVRGPAAGLYFRPEDMRPRMGGPAMAAAVELFRWGWGPGALGAGGWGLDG